MEVGGGGALIRENTVQESAVYLRWIPGFSLKHCGLLPGRSKWVVLMEHVHAHLYMLPCLS